MLLLTEDIREETCDWDEAMDVDEYCDAGRGLGAERKRIDTERRGPKLARGSGVSDGERKRRMAFIMGAAGLAEWAA